MRCAQTLSEEMLWQAIRRDALGVRFRRQVVLGPFIADFFAPSAKLVVEIDGAVHAKRREADAMRDAWMAARGIRVVRVAAWEVERDLASVVARVRDAVR